MAPSTMPSRKNKIKTDKRDAMKIYRCLARGSYSAVYVPTKEDRKLELKRKKQQIKIGDGRDVARGSRRIFADVQKIF